MPYFVLKMGFGGLNSQQQQQQQQTNALGSVNVLDMNRKYK